MIFTALHEAFFTNVKVAFFAAMFSASRSSPCRYTSSWRRDCTDTSAGRSGPF